MYFLQNDYAAVEKIISTIRPQISNERLAVHADYLEAQLRAALKDMKGAGEIASRGINRAKKLGAKEDANRLSTLLKEIEEQSVN